MLSSSALVLLATFLAPAVAQNSGSFDILTFNVAGLPAIINSNEVPGDKKTNTLAIGTKFAQYGYDVIHVQEDFNFHAYLYQTDNHPERTPTTGGVPFGSGLNTLSNYVGTPYKNIKWDKCDLSEGDCLTPKGFSSRRTQIQGIEIDFYNLHADAGSNTGDVSARRAGIVQILNYIEANSVGRAVIVAGDTNDRWTNTGRSIDLLTQAGFTDTWVQRIKGGVAPKMGDPVLGCDNPSTTSACETVDKILYRSGDIVLTPTSWRYDSSNFLQANGSILSDHNPIHVDFTWKKK